MQGHSAQHAPSSRTAVRHTQSLPGLLPTHVSKAACGENSSLSDDKSIEEGTYQRQNLPSGGHTTWGHARPPASLPPPEPQQHSNFSRIQFPEQTPNPGVRMKLWRKTCFPNVVVKNTDFIDAGADDGDGDAGGGMGKPLLRF